MEKDVKFKYFPEVHYVTDVFFSKVANILILFKKLNFFSDKRHLYRLKTEGVVLPNIIAIERSKKTPGAVSEVTISRSSLVWNRINAENNEERDHNLDEDEEMI